MTSGPDAPHRAAIDAAPRSENGELQGPVERDPFAALDSNEQTLIVQSEQLLPSAPAGLDSANLFESQEGTERRNLITGSLAIRYDRRSGVVGGAEAGTPAVAPTPSVRSSVLSGGRRQRWQVGLAAGLGALALGAILQLSFASREASAVRPTATSAPAAKFEAAGRPEVLVTPPSAPAPLEVAPGAQRISPQEAARDASAEPKQAPRP